MNTDPRDDTPERREAAARMSAAVDQLVAAVVNDRVTAASLEMACASAEATMARLLDAGVDHDQAVGFIIGQVATRVGTVPRR